LETQTDESLLVSDNDLKYLTREEAEQIIEHFKEIPQTYDRLVFWTGIPREWVQQWADEHGMLTLTSAMGPLMDRKDPRCLRRFKELEEWSKYIKGASRIFARYACKRGIVRVLTLPPSWADLIRPESTYRNIEEPVLKGISGCCCAIQINTVHLLTTLEELEYQTWPENHIPEKLRFRGAGSSDFRLPRWTRKAVKAATKSLRSNCVGSTVCSTPKPNGGKQSRDSTNAHGHSRLQSQQPQSKKRLQTQQTTSKKKQPQTQQTTSKKKQPQTQQTSSKKEQSQTQQTSSKKEQPQTQQTSSKEEQPQTQQTSSKREQPQTQQMSSKKKQLQTQQTLSKKKQPQTQQTSSKQQQQPQKQQTSSKKQPQIQKPQSNNPQPQKSKQPQQSQQPQSSRKLIIKAGA
jgi:hypothetical protein